MREYFTRVEDGQEITIEVNPNAYGYSQKLKWLLSVFIKFDIANSSSEQYEQFLDTKESLISFLEHSAASKFVGSRNVDGWIELYFYTPDSKDFTKKTSSFFQNFEYPFETHIVKDTKWDFYTYNLYPTEQEWHIIQTQKIIEMLKEEEDTLEVPRPVEHYISFATPTQKERFVARLPLEGFRYEDEIDSEEFDNGIALVKNHDITLDTLKNEIQTLYTLIAPEQGSYELWSTQLA